MALTVGTLRHNLGHSWELHAEAHVVIRAKRVFARARPAQERGTILLKDTPEICAELEWFMDRFPLEMAPRDKTRLRARADAFRERLASVGRLLGPDGVTRQFVELALPPRDYQRIAAELWLQTGNLLLADDVGLGKTVSAIAGLVDPGMRPALVVTLTHLPRQWAAELARFAPQLRTHIIRNGDVYDLAGPTRKGTAARAEQLELKGTRPWPDVVITSYSKLSKWDEALSGNVRSVVFDEVQELRTGSTSAKGVAAKHIAQGIPVLGLTATPIYNYGIELHHVLDVVSPDVLGTIGEFTTEWCTLSYTERKTTITEPAALGTYLRGQGVMLRRTRKQVGRELPGLTKVPHEIDVDESVLEKVSASAVELARALLAQGGMGFDKMRAAEEFSMLLRQATGIAKAPYVAEFVRLLVESGEQVLLYGWHHAVYDLWREKLGDGNAAMFTGRESQPQKQASLERFQSGAAKVLIMSLRSGAGVDGLQHKCRTVVFGELDWSPAVHEQCEGRIYRDGQPDPVMAYYPVSASGSDPIVADILGVKRGQLEGLRNPDGADEAPLIGSGKDLRRLAIAYLEQIGETVPAEAEAPAPLDS